MYSQKGLTLVELVVVITILSILLLAVFFYLNPFRQFQKAHDSTVKNDIAQIKTALDTYYNDRSCYPTTVPFGAAWKEGTTVYMAHVPQNNNCSSEGSSCYVYAVDGACPQWNVIFAKLSDDGQQKSTCELVESCLPQNYSDEWSCVVSGNVDCSVISSYSLPQGDEQFCPAGQRNYACTGSPARCNILPQGTGTYCSSTCEGAC